MGGIFDAGFLRKSGFGGVLVVTHLLAFVAGDLLEGVSWLKDRAMAFYDWAGLVNTFWTCGIILVVFLALLGFIQAGRGGAYVNAQ